MKEKPNYYAIIPALVRYDSDLKPNEKLLYGEITALTNKTGICFANNAYFAELYNVEKETISRWITHLKEKGYIRVIIKYKQGTKEILKRGILVNGTPIIGKINTFFLSRNEPIPDWLGKDINADEATEEEIEQLNKLLELEPID